MPKFIISMNLIIEADDAESAVEQGTLAADYIHKEAAFEYYLIAEDAKPVKTPKNPLPCNIDKTHVTTYSVLCGIQIDAGPIQTNSGILLPFRTGK